MASLTRDDLHDELQKFASDVLQNALAELRLRIVTDLHGLEANKFDKDNAPTNAGASQGGSGVPMLLTSNSTSQSNSVPRLGKGFRPAPKETKLPVADKTIKDFPDKASVGSLAMIPESDGALDEPFHGPNVSSFLDDDDVCEQEEASSLLEPGLLDSEDKGNQTFWNQASRRLARLVLGDYFSYTTCGVVILNSLLIGVQTDYLIRHVSEPTAETPSIFKTLDVLFCGIFTVELCLRFLAFGWSFFIMEEWQWNVFDLTVVTLQLSDILLHALCKTTAANPMDESSSVLRLLRLIRILRLMRVLRLVEELRTIVSSIVGSLKSLIWTLLLLMLLMYSCGVCITQVVADHLLQLSYLGDHSGVHHAMTEDLKYFFGTLMRTVLTLFESVVGGLSWDAVVEPLLEDISPWVVPVFCIYIAFVIFAVMNSVTGVFCEKATAKARTDQESFLANVCRRTFEKNILSHKPQSQQQITWKEFEGQLHKEEFRDFFRAINVCVSEAEGLFALLDVEKKGAIEFEQFMHGILKLHGPAKSLDLTLLMNETDQIYSRLSEHMASVDGRLNQLLCSMSDA